MGMYILIASNTLPTLKNYVKKQLHIYKLQWLRYLKNCKHSLFYFLVELTKKKEITLLNLKGSQKKKLQSIAFHKLAIDNTLWKLEIRFAGLINMTLVFTLLFFFPMYVTKQRLSERERGSEEAKRNVVTNDSFALNLLIHISHTQKKQQKKK
ncbi:hypothetical protein RFI_06868 [Reticulomyxa filosa]|uniref:Transmembrane protein n=1 Tax=Reticulomyxa filosa TaxID=46433 RepID=X6NW84_RETFI|nr:hypothetical protein RFI_06868 [Reticulomyxa filosa]|eukprot:ETO30251.1 hypothetical protein RFI_06868 [Reticulomyxa filosa]